MSVSLAGWNSSQVIGRPIRRLAPGPVQVTQLETYSAAVPNASSTLLWNGCPNISRSRSDRASERCYRCKESPTDVRCISWTFDSVFGRSLARVAAGICAARVLLQPKAHTGTTALILGLSRSASPRALWYLIDCWLVRSGRLSNVHVGNGLDGVLWSRYPDRRRGCSGVGAVTVASSWTAVPLSLPVLAFSTLCRGRRLRGSPTLSLAAHPALGRQVTSCDFPT